MNTKPRLSGPPVPRGLPAFPRSGVLQHARARGHMVVELVDLRDHPLPFFDEMASNLWMPSKNPKAIRWQQTIGKCDG
jgi:hypothetical protein